MDEKPCARCGITFKPGHVSSLYCGGICRRRASDERRRPILLAARRLPVTQPLKPRALAAMIRCNNRGPGVWRSATCRVCDQRFLTRSYGDVTCSPEHLKIQRRRAKMIQRDVRRARERDAFVAHVNRHELFERDEYICHLCGGLCVRDAVVPDWLAPTLDHVIPLALGGTHEPANSRTAHFICNARKGASDLAVIPLADSQLQLVG